MRLLRAACLDGEAFILGRSFLRGGSISSPSGTAVGMLFCSFVYIIEREKARKSIKKTELISIFRLSGVQPLTGTAVRCLQDAGLENAGT